MTQKKRILTRVIRRSSASERRQGNWMRKNADDAEKENSYPRYSAFFSVLKKKGSGTRKNADHTDKNHQLFLESNKSNRLDQAK